MNKICGLATVGILVLTTGCSLPKFTPTVTSDRLLSSATLGGDYLVNATKENGEYLYLYDPVNDEDDDSYNMLRHAGTTYSLLELYEATQDEKYLKTAEKGLDFLSKSIQPCELKNQTYTCLIDEEGDVKLGGNGLAMIAIAKYNEVLSKYKDGDYPNWEFESELEISARGMADWIMASQEEDGEFSIHKTTPNGKRSSTFVSDYYPGEAILGLLRLYELDPSATDADKYLDSAEHAADWLITVRDKEKTIDDINHDHWLLYGLNELYRLRPKEIYLKHAWKIIDAIEKLQGEEGGFYNPPRTTPTATRSEALVSAYELAVYSKTNSKTKQILSILDRAIAFELGTQITEENFSDYKNPSSALGGFRDSLHDHSIRIDYVQHNISAILGYREILKEISE